MLIQKDTAVEATQVSMTTTLVQARERRGYLPAQSSYTPWTRCSVSPAGSSENSILSTLRMANMSMCSIQITIVTKLLM